MFSGEGAQSRTVVVKTHPFAPTAPPQNVKVTPISSTTLSVTWRPPPVDDRNGDIIKYRVVYEVSNCAPLPDPLSPRNCIQWEDLDVFCEHLVIFLCV